ncbi:MAG: hypothetical protein R3B99_13390 [Polyangiales bacterium]
MKWAQENGIGQGDLHTERAQVRADIQRWIDGEVNTKLARAVER